MAVNTVAYDSKLKLQFDGGVDTNGKNVVKTKTYSKVKANATDDNIYNVAVSLSGLQTMPVLSVKRINEVEIEAV